MLTLASSVIFGVLFTCLALGIGLGVGLGTKRSTPVVSQPAQTSQRESTVLPQVSKTDGGVTVSQSEAATAPMRAARQARATRSPERRRQMVLLV